jgi:hypothetical protein
MRASMKTLSCFLCLAALTLGACGDDGGDDDDDDDDVVVDAGGDDDDDDAGTDVDSGPDIDAPAAVCTAAATYGDEALANPVAQQPNAGLIVFEGELNADELPDLFALQLYDGFGVFTDGIVPGTYEITGDEAQFATCGLCALLITDGGEADAYLATSGSVTITSVSPNLTGTVTNLTYTHVDIDENDTSTPNASGCESDIAALAFDAVVAAPQ